MLNNIPPPLENRAFMRQCGQIWWRQVIGDNMIWFLRIATWVTKATNRHSEYAILIAFPQGRRWRIWLRHCATSRKVAGSIPDGIIGIFHWHNPSGCTMALGLTQPLTKMSTRNKVKAAGAYGWQPYHLHVAIFLKSWSLNLLEPSGPVQACNGSALPFYWFITATVVGRTRLSFTCVRTLCVMSHEIRT
jgi:hypothetical protein